MNKNEKDYATSFNKFGEASNEIIIIYSATSELDALIKGMYRYRIILEVGQDLSQAPEWLINDLNLIEKPNTFDEFELLYQDEYNYSVKEVYSKSYVRSLEAEIGNLNNLINYNLVNISLKSNYEKALQAYVGEFMRKQDCYVEYIFDNCCLYMDYFDISMNDLRHDIDAKVSKGLIFQWLSDNDSNEQYINYKSYCMGLRHTGLNADAKGNENKPNYTNREFMNAVIIFQTALMDKMYDNQNYDKMNVDDRLKMAEKCGLDLRKLIHTYTNLDTHKIEQFL